VPGRVWLEVVGGPLQGRRFEFQAHDTFLFGRAPDCHAGLPVNDTTASRHHFLLEVNPPAARLRDLGSLNGTWVNGAQFGGRDMGHAPGSGTRGGIDVDLRDGDHVRGDGPLIVVYADFTCPRCAVVHARLQHAPVRRVFRHLALKAKHPRAVALARAAEAAAAQNAFWPFHDALYADQGRQEDPHLWALAERLGLDRQWLHAARNWRSYAAARVERDTMASNPHYARLYVSEVHRGTLGGWAWTVCWQCARVSDGRPA